MFASRKFTPHSLVIALLLAFLANVTPSSAKAADAAPWWNAEFRAREAVTLPEGTTGLVRVNVPAGAKADEIRVVAGGQPVPHWTQTLELSDVQAPAPEATARFPRLNEAKNGDLLLTYRAGKSHAASDGFIALHVSKDKGKTWGPQRNICDFGKGVSAQNIILLPTPSGRILAWASRFEYMNKGHERVQQEWSWSDDNGATWAPWKRFDSSNERSSYYMTDAIALRDGSLLAVDAAFPASGGGNCFAQAWRSEDGGKTWAVVSKLTELAENLGDEVGLLETAPGEVLCLLRDRRKQTAWRLTSKDGGKTWSKREDIGNVVGVFQRPLLTRLDEKTILATGRSGTRHVTAFVSRDNGRTFGERQVLEAYQGDGAYTGVVVRGPREVAITWYSDRDRTKGDPEVKTATLKLSDAPTALWFTVPKDAAGKPVYVYFDSPGAKSTEDRSAAMIDKQPSAAGKLGTKETK
jgi:hypothetical protein